MGHQGCTPHVRRASRWQDAPFFRRGNSSGGNITAVILVDWAIHRCKHLSVPAATPPSNDEDMWLGQAFSSGTVLRPSVHLSSPAPARAPGAPYGPLWPRQSGLIFARPAEVSGALL